MEQVGKGGEKWTQWTRLRPPVQGQTEISMEGHFSASAKPWGTKNANILSFPPGLVTIKSNASFFGYDPFFALSALTEVADN